MSKSQRSPGASRELALRTLEQLVGSNRGITLIIGLFGLVLVGWFTDSGLEFMQLLNTEHTKWHRWIGISLLPAFLLVLYGLASKAQHRMRPYIDEDHNPVPVRSLILFLSVLGNPKEPGQHKRLLEALEEGLNLNQFRRDFGHYNWRMAVEALDYHSSRLDHLGVIVSTSVGGRTGSIEQIETFRLLVKQLFPNVKIETPGELNKSFEGGVDFENNVEQLGEATEVIYAHLREHWRLQSREILIDVTGGQKTTSIVGASIALAEGRRVQYVSTHKYLVSVYDVSYR